MRTIAEALIKRSTQGGEELQEILRMPALNHAPFPKQDLDRPFCERIVIRKDIIEAISGVAQNDYMNQLKDHLQKVREFCLHLPFERVWIELEDTCCAWYCTSDKIFFIGSNPGRSFAWPMVWANTPELLKGHVDSEVTFHKIEPYDSTGDDLDFGCLSGILVMILLLINTGRTSTARSTINRGSPAERAWQSRRHQKGFPVFSHNVVYLAVPKNCEFRGKTVRTVSLIGRRGHLVIGHWRLIDGAVEPYWIWVESFTRGDESLGKIVKTHLVTLAGGVRRGYVLPPFAGGAGQRVPAEHLGR